MLFPQALAAPSSSELLGREVLTGAVTRTLAANTAHLAHLLAAQSYPPS